MATTTNVLKIEMALSNGSTRTISLNDPMPFQYLDLSDVEIVVQSAITFKIFEIDGVSVIGLKSAYGETRTVTEIE